VVDLGRVGLLPSRLDPDAEEDETPPCWSKQDLDRCYNRVLAYASVGGDRHLTGLAEAAQVLAAVGLRAADSLLELVTGELWCAACSPSAALADLVFLSMDIAARLKAPPSGRGLWDYRGAAQQVGVDLGTFFRWLDAGLLVATLKYAYEEYFAPEVLERFQVTYIFHHQAAQLLGVAEELVRRWVRAGWLRIVPGSEPIEQGPYLLYQEQITQLQVALRAHARRRRRSLPAP